MDITRRLLVSVGPVAFIGGCLLHWGEVMNGLVGEIPISDYSS